MSVSKDLKLLMIGCGNLGKALLEKWSEERIFQEITVVQPSLSAKSFFAYNSRIRFFKNQNEIPSDFLPNITVIAIKPQQIPLALAEYILYLKTSIVISLAVAVSIKDLEFYLDGNENIVRIMPNIAARLGCSTNLTYSAKSAILKQQVDTVFSSIGKMIWVDNEDLIDLLSPISGSGTAFFCFFAEILVQVAIKLGIKEWKAIALVQQTFLGSALLAEKNLDYEQIIKSVSSKGGITEAALNVFRQGLPNLIKEAIDTSIKRMNELKTEN